MVYLGEEAKTNKGVIPLQTRQHVDKLRQREHVDPFNKSCDERGPWELELRREDF